MDGGVWYLRGAALPPQIDGERIESTNDEAGHSWWCVNNVCCWCWCWWCGGRAGRAGGRCLRRRRRRRRRRLEASAALSPSSAEYYHEPNGTMRWGETASSGEQDSACLPLYLKCDSSIARNTWTEECGTYAVPRCRRRLMANESNPPTTRLVTGNDPGASSCRQIWWCVNNVCCWCWCWWCGGRAGRAGGRCLRRRRRRRRRRLEASAALSPSSAEYYHEPNGTMRWGETASSGEQDSACLPLYLKCDSSIARNTCKYMFELFVSPEKGFLKLSTLLAATAASASAVVMMMMMGCVSSTTTNTTITHDNTGGRMGDTTSCCCWLTRAAAAAAYFLPADAFLAAGLDFGVAAAFFGLGALGFLVGGLAVFLAFGAAAALPLAAAAGFLAAGFFFAAAAFLSLVAAEGFAFEGDDAALEAAPFFALPAADAAVTFLDLADAAAAPLAGLLAAGFLDAADLDSNLNEPEAPLPLVWIKAPDSTALFRYFLMKGANFSASTLY
ncbi:uncharacterized protein LOC135085837 isoform X2 [Ostrinia nubilalis]|uniref:uncharacterized protein LOC135085837 isoform X2 n=1 Tax=Ostrinia nubilalis TaxID=29057 RepID=UPI0030822EFE